DADARALAVDVLRAARLRGGEGRVAGGGERDGGGEVERTHALRSYTESRSSGGRDARRHGRLGHSRLDVPRTDPKSAVTAGRCAATKEGPMIGCHRTRFLLPVSIPLIVLLASWPRAAAGQCAPNTTVCATAAECCSGFCSGLVCCDSTDVGCFIN